MRSEDLEYLRSVLDGSAGPAPCIRYEPPAVFLDGSWRRILRLTPERAGLRLVLSGGRELKIRVGPAEDVRARQKAALLRLVQSSFPGWKLVRVLDRTDRVRHQTGSILRMQLASPKGYKFLLVVRPDETSDLADRLFSALILWWDQRKKLSGSVEAATLVPDTWGKHFVDRFPYLAIPVVCYQYVLETQSEGGPGVLWQVYPRPAVQLRVRSPYVIFSPNISVPAVLRGLHRRHSELELSLRHGSWELSWLGLPLAWQESPADCRFDILSRRLLENVDEPEFEVLLRRVRRYRRFPPESPGHPYYSLKPERWLESLVIRNHQLVDRSFSRFVYSQVPSFVDGERKVLDLLTATRAGRLAVLELKVEKNLALVFQALDYWDRVWKHARQGDFGRQGYFAGLRLRKTAPLLYLVCPLFEFHRVMPILRRYLRRYVRFRCVGLNSDWKRELRVIRRFEF